MAFLVNQKVDVQPETRCVAQHKIAALVGEAAGKWVLPPIYSIKLSRSASITFFFAAKVQPAVMESFVSIISLPCR